MDDVTEDNFDAVLKFTPRKHDDHPPLLVEPKRGWDRNTCEHKSSFVDNRARTVTCQKCGVQLDPFDRLYQIACRGAGLDSRIAEIRAEHVRQRKLAEARAAEKLGDVPNVLARLDDGDKIQVTTKDHSQMNVKFRKLTDDKLFFQYAGTYTTEKIEIENIAAVRIVKKA